MDEPMGWLLAQLATADCEAPGSGLLEQDANGWSSLAYVVAGIYVLVGVRCGRLRPVAIVMALALIAEGAGSVLFHGASGPGSQALHDAALLVILAYVVGWHVGTAITAARGAAVIVRLRRATAVWTPGLLALAAAAAVLWVLGRGDSPVCDPASLAQAHAAWHVLSAVVLVAWVEASARWTHLTTTTRRSTMAESAPTTRSKTLDVVVTFEEHDDHTDAHASLVLEGEKFTGFGRARRAPGDPDVPTVGDELALARAMHELSTRLLEAAEKGVADFEGRDVDLHL